MHCFVWLDQLRVCWADGDHCIVCVNQVWVYWADEDLSMLVCVDQVWVCCADGDLSLFCVCGSGVGVLGGDAGENRNPTCKCGNTSKVAQVKKEGPNKGRFFYACSGPREKQCKVGHDENVCVW